MTPDDNWHPVGMSNAIEAGNSAGTYLFGQELVVWRDGSGVAHVNEDRCPHRGMKLNFGFVRGDRIACLYHGWQFDRDGVCRYIPAHPALDVPVTIRVPVYPVQERGNMIWTTLSTSPRALPDDRGPTTPLRSIYVDSDIPAALEALADPRLLPFASNQPGHITLERVTGTLYTLSSGEETLMVGIQQMSRARIGLHLVYRSSEQFGSRTQRHSLGWVLRVRDAIEQTSQLNAAISGAT
jgi:nitrite reductase/ring-hydroxylating ferredoxin subunit